MYDVTATASNYALPDAVCANIYTYCTLSLVGTHADGTSFSLGSTYLPTGEYATYPQVHQFQGTLLATQFVLVRAYITSYLATTLSSGDVAVSDPYPTPGVSLAVGSIDRDAATGAFLYDVTVTASNYALPDAVCANISTYCTLYLVGTHADGTSSVLDRHICPRASTRLIRRCIGLRALSQRNSCRCALTSPATVRPRCRLPKWRSATVSNTGGVILAVGSIDRDAATDAFLYDVTVTTSNYALPDAVCANDNYSCYVYLLGTHADGTTQEVSSQCRLPKASTRLIRRCFGFQGTIRSAQLVSIRAYIAGSGSVLSTAEVAVTDPYPTPGVSLAVGSIDRDAATGAFLYDVTVTASNYALPDAVCASENSTCTIYLQGIHADGTTSNIGSTTVSSGRYATYPQVHRFQGTLQATQFVSVRAYVTSYLATTLSSGDVGHVGSVSDAGGVVGDWVDRSGCCDRKLSVRRLGGRVELCTDRRGMRVPVHVLHALP